MNPSLDKALYYLTGNGNIDEVSTAELEKLTKEHPYFSVGQLLLAKKLKMSDDERFTPQLQKTSVYFSNPYWLHYQLLNYTPADVALYSVRKDDVDNLPKHASVVEQNDATTTEIEADELEDALPSSTSTTETADENGITPSAEEVVSADTIAITTEFTSDEIEHASELAHESLSEDLTPELFVPTGEILEDVEKVTETVAITTEFTADEIEHASELAHEALSEDLTPEIFTPTDVANTEDNTSEINDSQPVPTSPVSNEILLQHSTMEPALQPVMVTDDEKRIDDEQAFPWKDDEATASEKTAQPLTQAEAEAAALSRDTDKMSEAFVDEVAAKESDIEREAFVAPEPLAEEDEHEKMFQSIKAMLDATTEEAGKAVEGAPIPIDPYHTIDYFASQGIKLDLEQFPEDKLGKQVKKFTHWLKQMKKLGPEDALEIIENTQAEAAVQKIADTSNTAREVVTEAMAQVLEKQGKNQKAIQLYIKLSFLNPHKSAYFADKIKNLKGI